MTINTERIKGGGGGTKNANQGSKFIPKNSPPQPKKK